MLKIGKYRLGIKLFRLGHQAVSHLNLREICRPFLTRIMDETKETVHLAVLDEDQVLYLDKVEGPHALRMPSRVGRRIPTYCTSLGKAMLSCLDDQEVRIFFAIKFCGPIPQTPLKPSNQLLADLRMIRKRGYSIDNEEIEIGLRCVGAPIRDYTGGHGGRDQRGRPVGSFDQLKKFTIVGKLVVTTAEEISIKLGYEKLIKAKAQ